MNQKQQEFFTAAVAGHNCVILGKAGTGKTFVLSQVFNKIKSLGKKIQVTSSSGISSLLFDNAMTLHSFAGIGTCRWDKNEILAQVLQQREKLQRWIDIETLIIDEGSMISARVFETIEFLARSIRKNENIFGGVQIIVSADFYQLPPVKNEFDNARYMFESTLFSQIPHIFELTEIMRQDQVEFINFLNAVAEGTCDTSHVNFVNTFLKKTLDAKLFNLEVIPKIICTNNQIFLETAEKLDQIPGNIEIFSSKDTGSEKFLKRCIAEKTVILKLGVPVMLLYNIDQELVNGLTGKVVDFNDSYPVVYFEQVNKTSIITSKTWTFYDKNNPSYVVASRTQIPLKVSWAITAHKSQGQTYDAAYVISGNEFVPGQLYVACSRVRSKEGLSLKGFELDHLIPPPDVVKTFYASIKEMKAIDMNIDLNCCLKENCFIVESENLPLLDINWEEDILSLEPEQIISIDNYPDSPGISLSDNDDEFVDPQIDFDMILATLESRDQLPPFPGSFDVKLFIEHLMIDTDIDVNSEDPSELKMKELAVYQCIINNAQSVSFLKLQWHNLLQNFKIKANGKYDRKELTEFCSDLFDLAVSDGLLNDFSQLIIVPRESLKVEHYTVCTDIIYGLGNYFLQILSSDIDEASCIPFVSITETSTENLGKVRYVMGWVLRKIIESSRKYIHDNISSTNQAVRSNIRLRIQQIKLTESMLQSYSSLVINSNFKESLDITWLKQNRTQGLLNVSDQSFLFAVALEEKRVNLLNNSRLNQLKGDLVQNSVEHVLKDDELQNKWKELCDNVKIAIEIDNSLFKNCVDTLFTKIVKKYFKMGSGEYLRDFRRNAKWKKI